ncbi:scamp family-domain-containing protein [Chytridium lagenaria]|nr:scamp family-domain-containing protein [Chytridium lagenaria]
MSSNNNNNPFDDDQNNPFSDPSISTALSGSAYVSLDDSFAASAANAVPIIPLSVSSASAPATGYGRGPASPMDANAAAARAALTAKEEELKKKEEELAARERALRDQEETLRSHGLNPPNWPPFYPLIYHNIDDEIPEPSRPLMTKIYRYWLANVGVLFVNMCACMGLLISHATYYGASDFGISLIYFFTMTALSFYLWYRPAYWAFQKDSALFFYVFLLFEGFHFLFAAYMTVGLPGSGSGGIINLLSVLSYGNVGAGVVCIVATIGWGLAAVGAFLLWTTVNAHTKRGGHSLESARTQAVTMGVLRSV